MVNGEGRIVHRQGSMIFGKRSMFSGPIKYGIRQATVIIKDGLGQIDDGQRLLHEDYPVLLVKAAVKVPCPVDFAITHC